MRGGMSMANLKYTLRGTYGRHGKSDIILTVGAWEFPGPGEVILHHGTLSEREWACIDRHFVPVYEVDSRNYFGLFPYYPSQFLEPEKLNTTNPARTRLCYLERVSATKWEIKGVKIR